MWMEYNLHLVWFFIYFIIYLKETVFQDLNNILKYFKISELVLHLWTDSALFQNTDFGILEMLLPFPCLSFQLLKLYFYNLFLCLLSYIWAFGQRFAVKLFSVNYLFLPLSFFPVSVSVLLARCPIDTLVRFKELKKICCHDKMAEYFR